MATLWKSKADTFLNSLGLPRIGGQIAFFLAGSSTPTTAFSDDGSTATGVTLTLDSAGRPQVNIYLDAYDYKIVVTNTDGTDSKTIDVVHGAVSADEVSFTPAGTVPAVRTVRDKLRELEISTLDFSGSFATRLTNAIAQGSGRRVIIPAAEGAVTLDTPIEVSGHSGTSVYQEEGSFIISALGAGVYPFTLTNCYECNLDLVLRTTGNGVLIRQTGTGESRFNRVSGRIFNHTGRASTKPAPTAGDIGVKVGGAVAGHANYNNYLDKLRLFDFETGIYLEDNANANFITYPYFTGYWYGVYMLCQETEIKGGFWDVAEGVDGSNLTEGVRIGDATNAANYNTIDVSGMEPGLFSRSALLQANTAGNIVIVADNTANTVLDNSGLNTVITKSSAAFRSLTISDAGGLIMPTNSTPSSAADTGVKGQVKWDSGFLYIATADNTWKRVAIATW